MGFIEFPFIEVPKDLRKIVGEPTPGTRAYRREGTHAERLVQHGAAALSAAELIAILVRTGLRGVNALDIGKQLIQRFGSLGAMAKASVDELKCVRGITWCLVVNRSRIVYGQRRPIVGNMISTDFTT
jgi:DNA repair protein RadC